MAVFSFRRLLLGTRYMGIEHFTSGEAERCAILLIEKKKNELLIRQKDRISYSEDFPEKWDKKLPYFITVNNKHVLQKEVPGTDASDGKLLHKAFPNIAWNEFYYEIWRLKTTSVIAISRKLYIDQLISSYQKQGILINAFSLGITGLSGIQEYTGSELLTTNTQTVSFDENQPSITPYDKQQAVDYSINGLAIQNSSLLAFAGILNPMLQSAGTTSNFSGYNEQLSDAYFQSSFFRNGLKTAVGSLLVLLLINFFIFNHYYRKTLAVSEEIALNKTTLEAVQKTKERLRLKEQQARDIMERSASESSWIINEITRSMPQSILLSELRFNPLEKKIKPDEVLLTRHKTILISGKLTDNNAVTVWIEALEKLKWTDTVVITHFGKNEDGETVFSLTVTLK